MSARVISLVSVLLLCLVMLGCGSREITFEQLFDNPEQYNGSQISIEGFYFHGFEVIVLSEKLEYSGYAEDHVVPKGKLIWISGGIPKDVFDELHQQNMMGPSERYGQVRLTGRFEYGGKYGHLGGYDQQITPTETKILPWSLPTMETSEREGFAIYLLAQDISVSQMPALSHFQLADKPLLSLEDIISYTSATEKVLSLQVPVSGKAFVVCVNRQQIYWGAFWTPLSSQSFDGTTIWKPLSSEQRTIKLELGYPSGSFFSSGDPRGDSRIIQSLEQAGKLK